MLDDRSDFARVGWFPFVVTFAAVLVRARAYLANPALWLDEAYLGLNIIGRDYAALAGPLEYDQGAPLGFLYLSRAAVVAFGDSEYVLRLVPFLASVAAPIVFLLVARRLLSGAGLNLAVVLFAVSMPLTRYAVECKPYAVDVLVVLVLTLLMFRCAARRTIANGVVLALVGVVSVLFSFTAILVLAGGGVALFLGGLGGRGGLSAQLREQAGLLVIGAAWLSGFVAYYWFNVRHLTGNAEVVAWHYDAYMPLPPRSADEVYWFLQSAVAVFAFPVGLHLAGIGLVLALLGAGGLLDRSRLALPILMLPLLFALIASGLHLYPFTQRFLLFLAPGLILIVAAGYQSMRHRRVALICAAVMLAHPVTRTAHAFVQPDVDSGMREIVAELAEHRQAGDPVYVYHWAHPTFRYYAPRYGVDLDGTVTDVSSRRDWGYYIENIERFRGEARAWFVFEHAGENLSAGEEQFFVTMLDRMGTQLEMMQSGRASLYLYDLSTREAGNEP